MPDYIFNEHNVCLNPTEVQVIYVKKVFEMNIKYAFHNGRYISSSNWNFKFGSHEGSHSPCSFSLNGLYPTFETIDDAINHERLKQYECFVKKLECCLKLQWHDDEKARLTVIKKVVESLNPKIAKQLILF